MIRHVVLFRLRPGVRPDDPRVVAAVATEDVLTSRFPAVGWTFGPNVSGRAGTADYAGTGDFGSRVELEDFLADPAHQRAGAMWRELADWDVADLELGQRDGG